MPGPAVHTIISEHLPKQFEKQGMTREAAALRDHRTALTFGAMGPDYFFFNLNDLTGMSVAETMVKTWNAFGQLQHRLHEFFEPLKQAMVDAKRQLDQGVQFLSRNSQLFNKLKNLINRLQATGKLHRAVMRGYVKKRVLDRLDPFGLYVSPYQQCESDHKDWWWFDTLHTRQTGDFATKLLDIARGRAEGWHGKRRRREQLLAYAVGYLSHLAADVVGHAYVNTMVGGPYRLNQAQRHTTQEKLMDVYAYDYYYNDQGFLKKRNRLEDRYYQNPELLNSGLHKNQQFTNGKYKPKDYQIDHSRIFNRPKRMKPIASGLQLPSTISHNFSEAAHQVYDHQEFGPLKPAEIDQSYRLWYLVLRNSTATLNVVKPSKLPQTPPVSQGIKKQWDKFEKWYQNNVGGKPGTTASTQQCGTQGNALQRVWDCLKTAAESAWNFANNAAEAANEFVETAVGVGQYLLNNGPGMPLDALNYFLQQLYENLYASYRTLMLLTTSLGFGYCFSDQVDHGVIGHLTDPKRDDHFGNTVAEEIIKPGKPTSGYPREGVQMGPDWNDAVSDVMPGLSQEGHLVVPTTPVEQPATVPGPDVYSDRRPEVFISNPKDDIALDGSYIAHPPGGTDTKSPSSGPRPSLSDYRAAGGGGFTNAVLGTAVELTAQLFRDYRADEHDIPNLNMSGDRGIGYPNWYSKNGCTTINRYRWWVKNTSPPQRGGKMKWLDTPIDPRFYPNTNKHY